ncbi:hypothetical protein EYF80_004519 [Liparis tanakae]|uniref:Uncharacterized protein n=1 Tax=Liparis tanakae TaxID=230148 RepID=A0A4Z2J4N6_9TELE|nr:hypothetical protein EYF80_004519 [Liparis tanakae]
MHGELGRRAEDFTMPRVESGGTAADISAVTTKPGALSADLDIWRAATAVLNLTPGSVDGGVQSNGVGKR